MPEVDRSAEFFQITDEIRRRKHLRQDAKSQARQQKSQFFLCASEIGKEIYRTSENLNKLTKLAKRKSLFDDKSEEIEELTVNITGSISQMQERLAQLEQIQHQQRTQQQAGQHSSNVVESLKGKLQTTVTEFTGVLKLRSENMKDQESRRMNFSKSSVAKPSSYQQWVDDPLHEAYSSHPRLHQDPTQDTHQHQHQHQHQQLVVAHTNQFMEDRANAVEQVESHIVELGRIFNQLSTIVAEHDNMLERIDDNVEMTLTNVNSAHEQFLKYYHNISSNRSLVLKMFAVLIFFIVLFGFFM